MGVDKINNNNGPLLTIEWLFKESKTETGPGLASTPGINNSRANHDDDRSDAPWDGRISHIDQ